MQQPSPRDDRPSLDRRFGDLNTVLLALAIGLAVLDGTCFATFKLIHVVAPLVHIVPAAGRSPAAHGVGAASGWGRLFRQSAKP